jgi:uncharacterized protein
MTLKTLLVKPDSNDYRMQVESDIGRIACADWNRVAGAGGSVQPFLRHEFLAALEATGCVGEGTGWQAKHMTLRDRAGSLVAAAPLYAKYHSYGEYVFDWAWADAYQRHGVRYYPKWLSAIPFTPVAGHRLLAIDDRARAELARHLLELAKASGLSSLHVLFPPEPEIQLLQARGMMIRRGMQFHWHNRGYAHFEQFLESMAQPKRKKIRAERRKVAEAGVVLRRIAGPDIRQRDWAFFTRCYETTYALHQSTPYLNQAFFESIGEQLPQHLMLIVAERDSRPIAASLIFIDRDRLYGRYWGALEYVPCLHFEVAYYQTIEAAIELRVPLIEGGAQGEHKMARGFTPTPTASAHWLAEPAFADAIDRFLKREGQMVDGYLDELLERSPFKDTGSG